MAALTEDQLALARVELGTELNEDDLQERYDRLGNDLPLAIVEVLRQRLADLLAAPASFSTPDYSQTTTENIKALVAQIAELNSAGSGGLSVVRVVQPNPSGYAR